MSDETRPEEHLSPETKTLEIKVATSFAHGRPVTGIVGGAGTPLHERVAQSIHGAVEKMVMDTSNDAAALIEAALAKNDSRTAYTALESANDTGILAFGSAISLLQALLKIDPSALEPGERRKLCELSC